MRKVFVTVLAEFSPDGTIMPRLFVWEDGRKYKVDRVIDMRPAASLKAGGAGMRYTCNVAGKQTFMFLEDNRWFMEGK